MRNLRAKTQAVAEPLGSAPCLVQHPEATRVPWLHLSNIDSRF